MRLESFLEQSARQYPDKIALHHDERRVTWRELDERANRFARALRRGGLGRGDRVVLFLDSSIQSVVGLFGVAKANGVFSIVNAMAKPAKLAFIVANLRPRVMVTQTRLEAVCREALVDAPFVERVFVADDESFATALDAEAPTPPAHEGIDVDLAYVIYTSGSTGFPKGVMMTHQSAVMGTRSITNYLENTADDVVLSLVPLSFDYGMYQVLMCASFGGTLILEASLAFPNQVLRKMASEGVTGLPVVPTTAAILLGQKSLKPGMFPKLRYITNTAAPLPPAFSARLQELFPSARIYCNYGLTETIRSTYLPPSELARRPTSVGKAMPNTEAYIVDEQNRRLPNGATGELVLRGANLFKGYWENAEATDQVLKPGRYPWEKVLHTGDLFATDEEGFLYYVARKDDMLKSRGEKVAPREVENVLYQLAGVREAAVIGVPDPVQGMAIRAVLALQPDCALTAREVQQHCGKFLEDYMIPSSVEFRAELPKTESGKIKHRELRDEAAHR